MAAVVFSMQVGEGHAALVTRPSFSFAQGMYGASVQSDGFVHFEGKSEFHGVLFEKGCTVGVGLDVVQVINSPPSTLNSSLIRQGSERHTTQRPTNLHALSFPPGPNPNLPHFTGLRMLFGQRGEDYESSARAESKRVLEGSHQPPIHPRSGGFPLHRARQEPSQAEFQFYGPV
jgi:hypothetical protein